MRPRRYCSFSLLGLAVLAAGTAFYFRQETISNSRETASLQAKLAAAELEDNQIIRGRVTSPKKLHDEPPMKSVTEAKINSDTHDSWFQSIAKSPKKQNRSLAYERSRSALVYAPYFHALDLSSEQIQQFEDNLDKKQADAMDLRAIMDSQGLAANDPAVVQWRNQSESDYASAQTSLLGETGYQQLTAFDQNIGATEMVAAMAGAATVAGLPLTSEQTNRLEALVAQASTTKPAANNNWAEIDWGSIDSQASAFLTPGQMDFLSNGEVLGPGGSGSRFLNRLGYLVDRGANAEASPGSGAAQPSGQ